jgi:uridylate kinase
MGGGDYGIDPAVIKRIAGELQAILEMCRWRPLSAAATSSAARAWRAPATAAADHMGMLATVMNAGDAER